jgi:serine phosphatase RsbU (regulator of sigma subunit)
MSSIETIWKLFEKSDDVFLIIENNILVKWNDAAHKILKDDGLNGNSEFSLTKFSPELQPGGEPSAEKEKKLIKIAVRKRYNRFEWVLKDLKNEDFFVEVTVYFSEDKEKSLLYMILRDINPEKKKKLLMESEITQKNEEIETQMDAIESQKEEIETQRDLAETQRDEISARKKELIDSINYASQIQSALLPKSESFREIFSDYFILNKPRDIVSGDFYWLSVKGNNTVVAVADCTGHGVPGAFMSILGVEFLNEIVNQLGIIRPNSILNNMKDRIIKATGQSGKAGETGDGMDISLITIDQKKLLLQYSGAFNPLFIIRNNQLIELKADKMSLGFFGDQSEPFTNHEISITNNDSIYLFSDGYKDQFGWRSNKKYYLKNFRELLLSVQNIPMKAQKLLLENNLKNWMGDMEQIDDILVVGLRI